MAADAWSSDCLRLARERRGEPDVALKCMAQAMGLMREGNRALCLLLKLQAARQAIAADAAAAERAAWVERVAVGRMGEALGLDQPDGQAKPDAPDAPDACEMRPPLSPGRG